MVTLTKMRELDIKAPSGKMRPLHISAASGLVCVGTTMYVVADDELHLGVFSTTEPEPGDLIRLFDGALPNVKAERKRRKPDLEALALVPASRNFPRGALLAVGSGSRPNRCRGALLGLDANGAVCGSPRELDLSPILDPLKDTFDDLNIEGAVVFSDELRLFQRGNKRQADNAIIRYSLSRFLDALQSPRADTIEPSSINRLDLGLIRGVPFCFTDAAALPNGDMVFCAVAEDSEDAYRDGPCIAAGIGIADNNGQLVSFQHLDRPYKVEGINARQDGDRLEILLVTDADDPGIPAGLFSTSIAM
ncbi:hypothetical protein [Rhizobium sp. Leaf386]|uniref:DUF6929 family protein n=1 Tax=Rhizobium sp. Leaf386 TaxID=1736359 RepID=UPI0007133E3E|nr:hypothetical protein [Rhizobium sp. Leaf386]KQS95553.1 hypothetical protein ASG50_24950 [Rhizobium sp. Leaf386]